MWLNVTEVLLSTSWWDLYRFVTGSSITASNVWKITWAKEELPDSSDTSCEESTKGKRIVIYAAGSCAAGQKPLTARSNSLHEVWNSIRGLHKRKAAVIKLFLEQNRPRKGKPREVPLERQNNIAADAGNVVVKVNKSTGSKNWKNYRWQEPKNPWALWSERR